jgi:hypothetical protein
METVPGTVSISGVRRIFVRLHDCSRAERGHILTGLTYAAAFMVVERCKSLAMNSSIRRLIDS